MKQASFLALAAALSLASAANAGGIGIGHSASSNAFSAAGAHSASRSGAQAGAVGLGGSGRASATASPSQSVSVDNSVDGSGAAWLLGGTAGATNNTAFGRAPVVVGPFMITVEDDMTKALYIGSFGKAIGDAGLVRKAKRVLDNELDDMLGESPTHSGHRKPANHFLSDF